MRGLVFFRCGLRLFLLWLPRLAAARSSAGDLGAAAVDFRPGPLPSHPVAHQRRGLLPVAASRSGVVEVRWSPHPRQRAHQAQTLRAERRVPLPVAAWQRGGLLWALPRHRGQPSGCLWDASGALALCPADWPCGSAARTRGWTHCAVRLVWKIQRRRRASVRQRASGTLPRPRGNRPPGSVPRGRG